LPILDFLAVPQRQVIVQGVQVDPGGWRGAQAVVVAQARALDPLGGGGAAFAAELAGAAAQGAPRRARRQRFGAVVAAGPCLRGGVRVQGGARHDRAHGVSPAPCSAGCTRAASSPLSSRPCRRHSRSDGYRRRFQSWVVSTSTCALQPFSLGSSCSDTSCEDCTGWLSTSCSGALRVKRPLTGNTSTAPFSSSTRTTAA